MKIKLAKDIKEKRFNQIHQDIHDMLKVNERKWVNKYLFELNQELKQTRKRMRLIAAVLIWTLVFIALLFISAIKNNLEIETVFSKLDNQASNIAKQEFEVGKLSTMIKDQSYDKDKVKGLEWLINDLSGKVVQQQNDNSKVIKQIEEKIQNKNWEFPDVIDRYYNSIWFVLNNLTYTDENWKILTNKEFVDKINNYVSTVIDSYQDQIYEKIKWNFPRNWIFPPKEIIIQNEKNLAYSRNSNQFLVRWAENGNWKITVFWTSFSYKDNLLLSNDHVITWGAGLDEIKNMFITYYSNILGMNFNTMRSQVSNIKLDIHTKSSWLKIYFPWIKKHFSAELVKNDKENDLALVRIINDNLSKYWIKPIEKIAVESSIWKQIATFWYPKWIETMILKNQQWNNNDFLTSVTESNKYQKSINVDQIVQEASDYNLIKPTISQGFITDKNDKNIFFDASINQWNSWWPILNSDWELVWITYALVNWVWSMNYGINGDIVREFLK